MTRTILLAFDVDEDSHPDATIRPNADDFAEALAARLEEFYPAPDGWPFRAENLRVAVVRPEAVRLLLVAAEVGLEGAPDLDAEDRPNRVADAAWEAVQILTGRCTSTYNGQPCGLAAGHQGMHAAAPALAGEPWQWTDGFADPAPRSDAEVLAELGSAEHHASIPKVPYSQAHACEVDGCRISQEEHHRLMFGVVEENRALRQRIATLEAGG